MKMPKLKELERQRQMLSTFGGYHRAQRITEGQFTDMENLTSDHYPVFSTRPPRCLAPLEGTITGMAGYDMLYYVRNGTLYQQDVSAGILTSMMTGLSTLLDSQIVRMGGYLLAMGLSQHQICDINNPLDTQEDIDRSVTGQFQYAPCTLDGVQISPVAQAVAPLAPDDGSYWMDTSGDVHVLKQWSKSEGIWNSVPSSYVKITRAGIGNTFRQYDGIRVWDQTDLGGLLVKSSGAGYESSFVVMDRADDFLIVSGLCDQAGTASVSANVERKSPQMLYVVECGNRLWGCSNDGHEIYASKLGDPYNWNCYLGISTDSYAVTVGSPGKFTGAVAYGGTVYFFKQDYMIKIQGSEPSNFQVTEIPCIGVQEGSERSLCVAEGMLLYKGKNGVFRYDGSLPEKFSDDLGMVYYKDAVGGAADGKYYLSMLNEAGDAHLFVYDIRRNLWHREDGMRMNYCAEAGEELYAAAVPVDGTQKLCTLNYHPERHPSDSALLLEKDIPFWAESGDIGLDSPDRKYIAQIQLRCSLGTGASLCLDVQYDSSGDWQRVADLVVSSKRSFTLPVTLRRCDHFRLRMSGRGECRIFSLTKTIEQGGML